MDLIKLIESRLLDRGDASDVYTNLKMMFGKLDYEIAYRIDRFRRQRMKAQRLADLESELGAKIATLRELSMTVSAEHEIKLQEQVVQLQWMLNQIRGTGSKPNSITKKGNKGFQQMDDRIMTRFRTIQSSGAREEIPIE